MKPKLLITLGCSWTEGVGCFEPQINYKVNKPMSEKEKDEISSKFYIQNLDNFHKNGWPIRVGKKLGFDKVINLGFGGASHSFSVKRLYEYFEDSLTEKYDILIIWLMTEPTRFSFYLNGRINNFLTDCEFGMSIMKEYLKLIKYMNIDPLLEQKFYIETVENFCKLKGIDLIITSWNESFLDFFRMYKSKSYLHKIPIIIKPPFELNLDGYLVNYSYCSHPNHQGYEWIANEMVKGIKENHDKWYSEIENEKLQYEFKGDPHIFKPNVI